MGVEHPGRGAREAPSREVHGERGHRRQVHGEPAEEQQRRGERGVVRRADRDAQHHHPARGPRDRDHDRTVAAEHPVGDRPPGERREQVAHRVGEGHPGHGREVEPPDLDVVDRGPRDDPVADHVVEPLHLARDEEAPVGEEVDVGGEAVRAALRRALRVARDPVLLGIGGKAHVRGPVPGHEPERGAEHRDEERRIAERRPPAPGVGDRRAHDPDEEQRDAGRGEHPAEGPPALAARPPLGDETDGRGPGRGVDEPHHRPRDRERRHVVPEARRDVERPGGERAGEDDPAVTEPLPEAPMHEVAEREPPEHAGVDEAGVGRGHPEVLDDLRLDEAEVEPAEIVDAVEDAEPAEHPPLPVAVGVEVLGLHRGRRLRRDPAAGRRPPGRISPPAAAPSRRAGSRSG